MEILVRGPGGRRQSSVINYCNVGRCCMDSINGPGGMDTMKGTKAMTPTERSRKHREQRSHDGWRLIQVWLNPPAAAALERLEESGH